MPPRRKGRESNPQGPQAHPFSRRDTAPMAALPRKMASGRTRTCTTPIKSRRLSLLSYGARMWPAGIEPAPPRVSDERSTAELRPRERGGRSWSRTSNLLFVRQALSRLSYPPSRLRDKGSNLDLHVQSVVSSRLDDPGRQIRSPSTPGAAGSRRSSRTWRPCHFELCHALRIRTMLSMPLAYPSTLDRRNRFRANYDYTVLRGGALEPGALVFPAK